MPDENCKQLIQHMPFFGAMIKHTSPLIGELIIKFLPGIIVAALALYTGSQILEHDMKILQADNEKMHKKIDEIDQRINSIQIDIAVLRTSNLHTAPVK